jgi:predicted nucleic acid-binding protein
MTDTADLNLVLAIILPQDRLKSRTEAHLASGKRLLVPLTVGIELIAVAHKHGLRPVEAVGAVTGRFEVEKKELLFAAAQAIESGELTTFDALHAADAYIRGVRLHTADKKLRESAFPTTGF